LSVNWTFNVARFLRIRLAAGGSALALTAIAGGVVGVASAGPAAPASRAAPAGVSSAAGSAAFQSGAHSVTLTALSSRSSAARPSVSGGGKGGGGKASQASKAATPQQIAWKMLKHFHWSARHQFPYLDKLWTRESGWNVHALNPSSGAAGIPQAVPGSKMASAGPNWPSNARTQIRWGLRYIRARYGSPRRAWEHEASVGWY
jgi:hypothetical protein